MTRSELEQLIDPLIQRLRIPCEKAMKDAGLSSGDIDQVVLVGGSTRIPAVQALAESLFGKAPNKSINPDEVVSVGAAILANELTRGGDSDILLLDVTPLSLGIETQGGVCTVLIPRNTTIPTSKKESFSTAADNQEAVTINVLQGEREFANDNRSLGQFNLSGIAPAPRGVPQIEVEFSLDANGILNVSATDKATNKKADISIQGSSGLDESEIKRMQEEAEQYAEADKTRRELVELKNQAQSMVHKTRQDLEEHGDKVDKAAQEKISAGADALEEAANGEDKAAIETALEALSKDAMELGKAIYEAAAAESEADHESAPSDTSDDDGVIDGEATEKKG